MKVNLVKIFQITIAIAVVFLVAYLIFVKNVERPAPTGVTNNLPKTTKNLELLGTWTLEKHEFYPSFHPFHPLLDLYYKERKGIPIIITMEEWYNNKFKLWEGAKHNVFWNEKHMRYIIKDVVD